MRPCPPKELQLIADGDFENQPEDAMTEEDQKALENAMMACLEEAFPELSTEVILAASSRCITW